MQKAICSLCANGHYCAVQEGDNPSICWCMTLHVDEKLYNYIKKHAMSKRCICKNCLLKLKEEKKRGIIVEFCWKFDVLHQE